MVGLKRHLVQGLFNSVKILIINSSTTNEKDNLVPSVVDHSEKFYRNLYGIELEKHILPYCSARFSWKA